MLQNKLAPLGMQVISSRPLHGGCIGQVYHARLSDGRDVVAKVGSATSSLQIEGRMLQYLREHSTLPVPKVLHAAPDLLVMSHIEGESRFGVDAQHHAAELLAVLHGVSAPRHGFEWDTLIGGLHQPNPWTETWLDFFAKQRLIHRAVEAERAGQLPCATRQRIEKLATQLDRWLLEPLNPSLLHGDVWTTNVLARGERISGFIDPAIYYGHPEIELAFITLFGTFGQPFFERYEKLRPIAPGFMEERRVLYNLYPLLVHVQLFGGGYVHKVEDTLRRFGY